MKSILNFPLLVINSIIGLFGKLRNPHHSSTLSVRGLIISFGVSIALFLAFYILQPFGLNLKSDADKIALCSIIGVLSLFGMLFCQFVLPFLLRSFYDEIHWTAGKQLLQWLLMIIIISSLIILLLTDQGITGLSFPLDVFKILGLSLIPLFAFVLIQENFHDTKFKRKAESLNDDFKNKKIATNTNPLLVLNFGSGTDKLSLIPNQLIYVNMTPTQSEFYYQHPFGVDKKTISISETLVKAELKDHPQFVAFKSNVIVNANAIQQITGNARGYEVGIARVNEMIKIPNKYKKNIEKI